MRDTQSVDPLRLRGQEISNDEGVLQPRIDQSPRVSGRAWVVVGMMFLFMIINFADKAVLGLAAIPIMKDLNLTNEQFGQAGSALFLLFSISAILVGFIANRVSSKLLIAVMAVIWAFTQLPMIGMVSFSVLIACRVVLGAGEGPAYPVALHAVYKWFPNDRRAVPTSLVQIGGSFGVGILAPLLTWIIVTYSWHTAFGCLGLAGLLWVSVWMFVGKEGPLASGQVEAGGGGLEHVPYSSLLSSRTVVGVIIAGFAGYWGVALSFIWLPAFLMKAGGYTPTQASFIVGLPSLLQIIMCPGVGYISQKLRTQGVTSRVSRGLLSSGSVTAAGVALILLANASNPVVEAMLVMVAFTFVTLIFTLGPPLIGEVTPTHQRGAMLGINNAIFTTAGLVAPWFMGRAVDAGVDAASGFRSGFLFSGALIAIGGALAMVLINPERDLARFKRRRAAVASNEVTIAHA
jgi:MFS family permease